MKKYMTFDAKNLIAVIFLFLSFNSLALDSIGLEKQYAEGAKQVSSALLLSWQTKLKQVVRALGVQFLCLHTHK